MVCVHGRSQTADTAPMDIFAMRSCRRASEPPAVMPAAEIQPFRELVERPSSYRKSSHRRELQSFLDGH